MEEERDLGSTRAAQSSATSRLLVTIRWGRSNWLSISIRSGARISSEREPGPMWAESTTNLEVFRLRPAICTCPMEMKVNVKWHRSMEMGWITRKQRKHHQQSISLSQLRTLFWFERASGIRPSRTSSCSSRGVVQYPKVAFSTLTNCRPMIIWLKDLKLLFLTDLRTSFFLLFLWLWFHDFLLDVCFWFDYCSLSGDKIAYFRHG